MRVLFFAVVSICLSAATFAATGEGAPVKIQDAVSPDGHYTLTAVMQGPSTCHLEIKAKASAKTLGQLTIGDYHGDDRHCSIAAVWKEDSSACAVNINLGHNVTTCHILTGGRNAWSELSLSPRLFDKMRKEASQAGGKAQDLLSADAWLPGNNLKVSFSGNAIVDYSLVFHLVHFGKAHLELLEAIASKSAPSEQPRISEVACTGHVFAGGPEGSADGPAATARFTGPSGLAVDSAGNIFVADRINDTIRRINPAGVVETLAGAVGQPGATDGTGNAARFWYPQGLATDAEGNVYVADTRDKSVRKVTPRGAVTTVGTGFKYPTGLAVDRAHNVYVADAVNDVVQKIAPSGAISIVAGKEGESGAQDGRGGKARFRFPSGVAAAEDGTLYVVDRSCVRKIDPKGNVTTLAGSPEEEGRADGTGGAARFWGLTSIALDGKGNLYVADQELKNLRRISARGVVQTLRTADHGDFPLQNPMALTVDSHGRIFVADQNAQTILLIEPAGSGNTTVR
jgi:sugar lactone lactonase YvrE